MTDVEETEEIEGEHFMKVPMGHYNSLVEAADIGFETLVERRNRLREIARQVPQYPERDSGKMTSPSMGLLDGVPLRHDDIQALERIYSQRIARTAEALNHQLHAKRYR